MGDLQIKFWSFVQVANTVSILKTIILQLKWFFLGILLPKAKQAQKRWFSTQVSLWLVSSLLTGLSLFFPLTHPWLLNWWQVFFFLRCYPFPTLSSRLCWAIQPTSVSTCPTKLFFKWYFFPMHIFWRQKWSSSKFPNGYASWRLQDLTPSCFQGCS